ncbi:MAG TPA: hypothetical protein VMV13_03345 [Candidatus Binataceae bacterium]|nr:hypothetical protein [Candidatus Binataceae bacterium]
MKSLGRLLAIAVVVCALPLMTGCSNQQGPDSTAAQAGQYEPPNAAAPATDAPPHPQQKPQSD